MTSLAVGATLFVNGAEAELSFLLVFSLVQAAIDKTAIQTVHNFQLNSLFKKSLLLAIIDMIFINLLVNRPIRLQIAKSNFTTVA
ncbi:hypothetical protein QG034_02245 [Kingella kingae]|uniref:hypothetical protein n=1 Tax=Kingella kingae TaxID=504 RepID=UPI00050A027E|nr:hypothetical protein [Kingella kingae]MDK4525823.1 hypothetical protein [Kingella kingae]MDK4531766.1 hypothetical protein [Kingella kingae]